MSNVVIVFCFNWNSALETYRQAVIQTVKIFNFNLKLRDNNKSKGNSLNHQLNLFINFLRFCNESLETNCFYSF